MMQSMRLQYAAGLGDLGSCFEAMPEGVARARAHLKILAVDALAVVGAEDGGLEALAVLLQAAALLAVAALVVARRGALRQRCRAVFAPLQPSHPSHARNRHLPCLAGSQCHTTQPLIKQLQLLPSPSGCCMNVEAPSRSTKHRRSTAEVLLPSLRCIWRTQADLLASRKIQTASLWRYTHKPTCLEGC